MNTNKLDDYDVAGWNAFYAENPGFNRSVGAEGDPPADPPKDPPADPPKDPPKDPPADPPKDPPKDPPADPPKDPPADPKPSDKEAALLAEVMNKKAKIGTLAGEVAALKEAAKAWEGIDNEAVKKLLKDNATAAEQKLIDAGEFTKVKEQMNDAKKVELDKKDVIIADLNKALAGKDTEINDLSIGNTFSASKFIAEKLTLPAGKARALFGAHFERDEGGNVVGYNLPVGADGRAPLVDGSGVNLAFDKAFEKIIGADPDSKSLLRSKVKPGAGSGTDPLGGPDGDPPKVAPGAPRIAAGLASGMLKEAKGLNLGSD